MVVTRLGLPMEMLRRCDADIARVRPEAKERTPFPEAENEVS